MNYLSLFSGIGGLDLGLDRAGMTCVGQVEINEWCRRLLAKHWPEVARHDDVRTAPAWWLGATRPSVDLVAGGFPCQPFSTAGRQQGIADERWGWPWFADVVRAVRPRYVLVENVAALIRAAGAFSWILADLVEGGYDADWDCVPAAAVGAPHLRDRLFLVAHSRAQAGRRLGNGWRQQQPEGGQGPGHVADTEGDRRGVRWPGRPADGGPPRTRLTPGPSALADADGPGRQGPWVFGAAPERGRAWAAEPDVGRVAHGIPGRVDRLRGLGNAVVPQVAEHVGRLIIAHAEAKKGAA